MDKEKKIIIDNLINKECRMVDGQFSGLILLMYLLLIVNIFPFLLIRIIIIGLMEQHFRKN